MEPEIKQATQIQTKTNENKKSRYMDIFILWK
jgi:hypothetical protein